MTLEQAYGQLLRFSLSVFCPPMVYTHSFIYHRRYTPIRSRHTIFGIATRLRAGRARGANFRQVQGIVSSLKHLEPPEFLI
jgi:hypothetical protein